MTPQNHQRVINQHLGRFDTDGMAGPGVAVLIDALLVGLLGRELGGIYFENVRRLVTAGGEDEDTVADADAARHEAQRIDSSIVS